MQISSYEKNGYIIYRFGDKLHANTDISALRYLMQEAVSTGRLRLAVYLPEGSFLSTKAIGTLIRCAYLVSDNGGRLTVISPNDQVIDIMRDFELNTIMTITESEETLVR